MSSPQRPPDLKTCLLLGLENGRRWKTPVGIRLAFWAGVVGAVVAWRLGAPGWSSLLAVVLVAVARAVAEGNAFMAQQRLGRYADQGKE